MRSRHAETKMWYETTLRFLEEFNGEISDDVFNDVLEHLERCRKGMLLGKTEWWK